MFGKVCLVFLHGSGSCGYDIAGYLDSVPIHEFNYNTFRDAAASHSIDILTPTSDRRRYSAMGGEKCNVWFDRTESFMRNGLSDSEDFEGAEQSINQILDTIHKVENQYDHVFIGGFSMGGGLALHTLRKDQPAKLRGVFSMGSFLVQESAVVTGPLGRCSKVPLLMMHGESDGMIRCEWGRQTASNLLLRGVDVQFRTYKRVDHDIDTTELADLLAWVRDVLHQHTTSTTNTANTNIVNTSVHATTTGSKSEAKDTTDAKYSDEKGYSNSASSVMSDYKNSDQCEGAKMDTSVESEVVRSAALLTLDTEHHAQQKSMHPSGGKTAHLNTEQEQAQRAGMHIPYTIEYLNIKTSSGGTSSTTSATPSARIHYTVPQDLIAVLTARPVLACGSMFEIQADSPHGVQVLLESADPHSTAVQIGLRLQNRISSGSASLNPCPIS